MAAVVRLRGLPWSVSAPDIIKFMAPVPVGEDSITMLINHQGRPSGECFVWIHEDNMNQVLSYDRKKIGSRYIEVFESNEDEYSQKLEEQADWEQPVAKEIIHAPVINMTPISAPKRPLPGAAAGTKRPVNTRPTPAVPQNQKRVKTEMGAPRQQIIEEAGNLVRARGLPFNATLDQVVAVFQDLGITENDVHLTVMGHGPRAGDPSGECYLEFPSEHEAQNALEEFQRVMIGERYLELFSASKDEFVARTSACVKPAGGANQGTMEWVRLRGLPFHAAENDIRAFCAEYAEPMTISLKYNGDGRPSGEAFVQFDSDEVASGAIQALHKHNLGSRYVEVFQSNSGEAESLLSGSNAQTNFLRLRGVPFQASEAEIAQFCSQAETVRPNQVTIKYSGGRPSGEAYVRFNSQTSAQDAQNVLDRQTMGARYIEVFLASKDEVPMNAGVQHKPQWGAQRYTAVRAPTVYNQPPRGPPAGWNKPPQKKMAPVNTKVEPIQAPPVRRAVIPGAVAAPRVK